MIIAQATSENLHVLTSDQQLTKYGKRVKLV
jgi:PIN domain nuclease of toxin-antitoxin system